MTTQALDQNLVVSVIAPLHNDADILEAFLLELTNTLSSHYVFYEIILVDDGSTDDTTRLMEPLLARHGKIRYFALTRHCGREVALAAGLESAIGDFVTIISPATDPVAMIPELIARSRAGSGVLCGVSLIKKHHGAISLLASKLFHAYCRRFLHFDYKENSTDFCVFSRQAVNSITRIKDRHRYLRVFTATLGDNQEFFSYTPIERKPQPAAAGLFDQINTAIEIAIANSRHPLRMVSRLGLLMSFMNFLYVFYIIGIYLFKNEVAAGWTTASLQHTTMFFFVFLILAVVCEYVGRILEETQDRPLYFVSVEMTSSVRLEDSVEKNIVNETRSDIRRPNPS